MLDDLDRTIGKLLGENMIRDVSISFATPDESFPPSSVRLPAVDVFLYDIRENRELRTNEPTITKTETGKPVLNRPPTRIECSYLITAWCSDSVPDKALEEHKLLGEVLEILIRFHTVPEDYLEGTPWQSAPSLRLVSLQPGYLEMAGPFWQALGGKPRASLNLSATVASEVPEGKILAKPPSTRILRMRQKRPEAKYNGEYVRKKELSYGKDIDLDK